MVYVGEIPAASNRATYIQPVDIDDAETGIAIPQADLEAMVSIVFEIAYQNSGSTLLSATLANGKITVEDDGVIEIRFERSEVTGIVPGPYNAGLTMTDAVGTEQVFAGTIQFYDGVVAI